MKREFYFTSSDKKNKIHGIEWRPDCKVIAVVQIIHGMVEHIDRYDTFAKYLNLHGICVIGHDHLGHGQTAKSSDDFGYIADHHGNRHMIQDIHRLRKMIDQKYPDLPHFIMGHSMGSFLTRQYLMYYADGLAGTIIMGTGYHPSIETIAGKFLCSALAAFKGWRHRSPMVDYIGIGNYNTAFEPCDSKRAWVTSNREELNLYESDPFCNFIFTLNGYHTLMETLQEITHTEYLDSMDKSLPLLFISGSQDPVGGFEKGVRKVYHQYREAGFRNLRLKFYPEARHEVLHEDCKEDSFNFLYEWITFTINHMI